MIHIQRGYDKRNMMYMFYTSYKIKCGFNSDMICAMQKMVITTKSVEYMPFFVSLGTFGNGVAWTTYALIRFDPFIAVSTYIRVLWPKQNYCIILEEYDTYMH